MSTEPTWPPQRRSADQRIGHIEQRLGNVENLLMENTKTTNEVKDILTTFKTLGAFAKWISAIGAAIIGLWAALKGIRG